MCMCVVCIKIRSDDDEKETNNYTRRYLNFIRCNHIVYNGRISTSLSILKTSIFLTFESYKNFF